MQGLFESGRIVDLALVFVVLEVVALLALRRRRGRGLNPAAIATLLAPGVCLFLALRAALTGAPWPVLAGWLTAALITHVLDLWARWRASDRPQ
ncbi:hypothetical protein EV659_104160 [Rhodothalassium salexigens DSM 2132]|uniref:DUF2568 domain-containing protein n=2 Tax=Rhodothalassium salexigens TaxID=1086 RepID=A0A4R2PIK2_RHOSA|nr:hypothetical protein [Rhodothalassium salexigens DSM 2132]TCP35309.1 hypothetical protein EV659_104160 [Rhodothalassium salexigens DSM 2132]